MRVELSTLAAADLEAIFIHGADRFGDATAEAYLRGFSEAFATIAEHPRIGALHDIVRPPIHSLSHGVHRIFYDVRDGRVVVQRVLHKAMDVERWI